MGGVTTPLLRCSKPCTRGCGTRGDGGRADTIRLVRKVDTPFCSADTASSAWFSSSHAIMCSAATPAATANVMCRVSRSISSRTTASDGVRSEVGSSSASRRARQVRVAAPRADVQQRIHHGSRCGVQAAHRPRTGVWVAGAAAAAIGGGGAPTSDAAVTAAATASAEAPGSGIPAAPPVGDSMTAAALLMAASVTAASSRRRSAAVRRAVATARGSARPHRHPESLCALGYDATVAGADSPPPPTTSSPSVTPGGSTHDAGSSRPLPLKSTDRRRAALPSPLLSPSPCAAAHSTTTSPPTLRSVAPQQEAPQQRMQRRW